MTAENVNAYLRTKVLTAPPEHLRLMLIEGAIKFTRQGVEALHAKDWEGVYTGYMQARNIILELMNSVRPDVDPELCSRVTALYTFMYTQLVDSGFEKDAAKGEKVVELLEFERETWRLLLDKLAEERASGVKPAANASPRPTQAANTGQGRQGTIPSPFTVQPSTPNAPRPVLSIQG